MEVTIVNITNTDALIEMTFIANDKPYFETQPTVAAQIPCLSNSARSSDWLYNFPPAIT
jgi:hypothetical protein